MTTVAILYAGCEIAADIEPGRRGNTSGPADTWVEPEGPTVGEYRLLSIDHDAWKEWWWENQIEGVTLLRPVSPKAILHYLSNDRAQQIDKLLLDEWERQERQRKYS